MHELAVKIRYSNPSEPKHDSFSFKKQSKFDLLYNQAFQQVKKKFSNHQQNFPILKLKSYDNTLSNYHSQRVKNQLPQFEQMQKPVSNPLIRHKSINTISVRYSASPKKNSVNKILWEKKMSLETLRISSTKRPSKATLSKELQKQSLKHLRQKTAHQSKETPYGEEDHVYSHMSIIPLSILSSKEERDKYLSDKKKMKDKFKITSFNEKDKNGDKKSGLELQNEGSFRNKLWEVDRDEDEFINFVKHKISGPYHN